MNTSTLRIAHGVQALTICATRESVPHGVRFGFLVGNGLACRARRWSTPACGCQTLRKSASAAIETIAATTSTSHGPWKFETRNCGTANDNAGDQDRRPDLQHPPEAGERPDQPERHEHREERQLAADHRTQLVDVEPGHRCEHDHRRAQRTERDRRGVRDQRQPRGGERLEAEPHQDRRRDGDRRAEARGAFEERAEAERDQQQLQAAIRRDAGDALLQHVEQPDVVGQVIHEDDVEHDPADRQQPEQRAEDGATFRPSPRACRMQRPRPTSATIRPRIAAQCALTWKKARLPSSTTIGSAATSVETTALPNGS